MMETATKVTEADPTAFPELPIAITATFTPEPIAIPLNFWIKELGLKARTSFAPYNQVFQQLLDPTSLLGQNTGGINLVLVRFEDWTRFRSNGPDAKVLSHNVEELTLALRSFATRSSTPTLVWVSPPSQAVLRDRKISVLMASLHDRLRVDLQGFDSLHLLGSEELELYPVDRVEDPQRDRIGHIPFTPKYFTGLATAIARQIHRIRTPPFKVLVLDCDNTLWQGVVGEDGAMGITFPPGKLALQEFVIRQQTQGMVVCLVSKNVEPDVVAVFEKRPEMLLKREHLVSWRINWQTKSLNIAELARELNLGLESFIFLDDNPVECAEMRAALPQVVTLELPSEDSAILEFLRHVWAFDRLRLTEEDRQRTLMYRQDADRNRFQQQAPSIDDFLSGLQLNIDIAKPGEDEWPRFGQLTQRTNQFNFTTIRRTEAEVRRLDREGLECLRVQVSDRFGAYGLVGGLIFGTAGDELRIDTMLLSCRVLGRGIEHTMLARLGQLAVERGLAWVATPFIPTTKNQPAADFLQSVGSIYRQETENGIEYRFPAQVVAKTKYKPGSDAREQPGLTPSDDAKKNKQKESAYVSTRDKSALYMRIATDLRPIEVVHRIIETEALARRPEMETPWVEPQTPAQRDLADLWARLLHLDRVGIRDDFTALGGTSLIAAQIFAEIEGRFGFRLPMTTILEAPTIEQLADHLVGGSRVSLKLLKPGSEGGPALFLIHDGDGETLLYVNLARRLPEDVTVYGIEPFGTRDCPIRHTRIADMASYYVDQIRRVRSQGPYFLGGMCAGGVIAFEIALQLRAKDHPVGFVALLDSAAPGATRRVGLVAKRRRARFFQALHGGQKASLVQHLTGPVVLAATKARNLVVYEVTSRARRLSNRIRFRMFRKLSDRGWQIPKYLQGLSVRTVYELAEKEYAPTKKLDAPLLLFQATNGKGNDEPFVNIYSDSLLGWGPNVAAELQVVEVAGGHSSMLQEPHVDSLAEGIRACFERVLAVEAVP